MENSVCNPNFALDAYIGQKPISVDELKKIVANDSPEIQIDFKRKGYITSKEYPYITYANFHETKNCALNYPEEKKTEEQTKMSKQNMSYMEEYFSACAGLKGRLEFAARKSNECILLDANLAGKIDEIGEKEF